VKEVNRRGVLGDRMLLGETEILKLDIWKLIGCTRHLLISEYDRHKMGGFRFCEECNAI
jgi:hypothetical protein